MRYFKSIKVNGRIGKLAKSDIESLCHALYGAASLLLSEVGLLRVSKKLLNDLTLLTVRPQFIGSANNARDAAGILQVFEIIKEIVVHSIV